MLSLEGKQLGNYDVIRRIRVGGMGAVYEGRQRTAFGRRVAIKVILGDYAADREMRRRFAREARTIARLQHPHILPLIEFGDANGILYLVMPFIEGGTLTSYLRRTLPDLSEVAAIFQQLLDAVEYAHDEGLVHRDIKSSNVLLERRRSGPPHVYLADFGLVRTLRAGMEDTGPVGKPIPLDQVPGTPHYMAPEQTRGVVTPLTDIYALGVLLYQLLTGELPYQDKDEIRVIQMHLHAPLPLPSKRDASIPPELDSVVRTAMAKRPEERYRTIAALRAAFQSAMRGPVAPILEDDTSDLSSQHPFIDIEAEPPPPPVPQPFPRNPTSLMKEEPSPIIVPRRARNEEPPVIVREARAKYRNTDTIWHRQRNTEEPSPRESRRGVSPVLAIAIVPMILLVLLLMPRVLGVSIFPSGFPVFGTPPVATVYVTAQSKILQDSYVLTASPQVKNVDLTTYTIPDRVIKNTASDSIIVRTTGMRTIAGERARGNIEIINRTDDPIRISAQRIFTSRTGVQVRLTQDVQVPPREDEGKIIVQAVAVNVGSAGNIAAHTLDGTCCNNGIMIRNPTPFSGGVDGQTMRIVVQSDLDGGQKALAPRLQQQIAQQLQKQLTSGEVMAGPPTYKVETSSNEPVGKQVDQVQVTVKITGNAIVYNRNVASKLAGDLLSKNASQTLGKAYQQQGAPTLVEQPRTVRQGKDGIINLSVAVRGLWVYNLTQEQMSRWPQAIRGSTTEAARAFLKGQPGVKEVQIQLPFGTDYLPTAIEQIKIVLVNNSSN